MSVVGQIILFIGIAGLVGATIGLIIVLLQTRKLKKRAKAMKGGTKNGKRREKDTFHHAVVHARELPINEGSSDVSRIRGAVTNGDKRKHKKFIFRDKRR